MFNSILIDWELVYDGGIRFYEWIFFLGGGVRSFGWGLLYDEIEMRELLFNSVISLWV